MLQLYSSKPTIFGLLSVFKVTQNLKTNNTRFLFVLTSLRTSLKSQLLPFPCSQPLQCSFLSWPSRSASAESSCGHRLYDCVTLFPYIPESNKLISAYQVIVTSLAVESFKVSRHPLVYPQIVYPQIVYPQVNILPSTLHGIPSSLRTFSNIAFITFSKRANSCSSLRSSLFPFLIPRVNFAVKAVGIP